VSAEDCFSEPATRQRMTCWCHQLSWSHACPHDYRRARATPRSQTGCWKR
jgi:hypothetical protein